MKAIHIAIILVPVAAVSATYILLRPDQPVVAQTKPIAPPVETIDVSPNVLAVEPVKSNNVTAVTEKKPVQSLEERDDAMLFEIDALQNTPFDQAVTMPFDR